MTENQLTATSVKITSSRPTAFVRAYRRTKVIAVASGFLWVFALLELLAAHIFERSSVFAFTAALVVSLVLSALAALYFRSGMGSSQGNANCQVAARGCGREGCDANGGSCLSKLSREASLKIEQMEQSKLALLLRRRIGVDVVLPVFWFAIGVKLLLSAHGISLFSGSIALMVGAVGLLASRVYLASVVFSGQD